MADASAAFYGAMLDWTVKSSPGWADVRSDGQCISFQQVDGYTPPDWPGQKVPQQMHLDVVVDDLDAAEEAVLKLGATSMSISRGPPSGCFSIRRVTRSVLCRE